MRFLTVSKTVFGIVALMWLSCTRVEKEELVFQVLPFENEVFSIEEVDADLPLSSSAISMIEFINRDVGFLGSLNGELFRTDDGGKHWTKPFDFSRTSRFQIFDLCFTDDKHGFLAGGLPQFAMSGKDPFGGILIETFDGGKTWKEIYHQTGLRFFYGVSALSDGRLILCSNESGNEYRQWIRESSDTGKTWNSLFDFPGFFSKCDFKGDSIAITSIDDISNNIYLSTDGGRSWNNRENIGFSSTLKWADEMCLASQPGTTVLNISPDAQNIHTFARLNELSVLSIQPFGISSYLLIAVGSDGNFDIEGNLIPVLKILWTRDNMQTFDAHVFKGIPLNFQVVSSFYSKKEGYILSDKLLWCKMK